MRRSTRYKRRAPRRKKPYRKKTSRRSSARTVKSIARRVVTSLVETKRFAIVREQYLWAANPTTRNYSWTYRPVFTPLDLGTTPYSMIGSEILDPMIKMKFTFSWAFDSIFSDNPSNFGTVHMRVYLVSSNDESLTIGGGVGIVSPTAYPQVGGSSDPGWFYQPNMDITTLNGNNVKVLKSWYKKFTPTPTFRGTTEPAVGKVQISGKMQYRWKRKMVFQEAATIPSSGGPSPTRTLRGNNYFILVGMGMWAQQIGVANLPVCYVDSFLYYKDP